MAVRILKEGALIGLAAVSIYLLLALVSYDPGDPGWSQTGENSRIENAGGPAGAWLADVTFLLFGYLAYLFPLMLGYRAWQVFRGRDRSQGVDWLLLSLRIAGLVLVMVAGAGLVAMHYPEVSALPYNNGGLLGAWVAQVAEGAFNYTGGTLMLLAVFLFGMTVFTDLSWLKLMDETGRLTLLLIEKAQDAVRQWQRQRAEKKAARQAQQQRRETVEKHTKSKAKRVPPTIGTPPKKSPPKPPPARQASLFEGTDASAPEGNLPPLKLLDPADTHNDKAFSKESLEAMSKLLELKLKDFNIDIEVVEVQPGPVVTRFEIQPAPGIKASRITNLAKDLARSLAVISVRVVEVIPGKSVMGIEIPNEHREIVRLSEVLATDVYEKSRASLTLALGHDIAGQPVIADLAKMPHLLVAGTTGAGKSVGGNVMLLSMLYKATPEQVRLMLVDPKMLELSVYEGIPHLLTPVITDMKDAANGLRWCVGEMERRYKLMSALGVRNLAGYNRKVEEARRAGEPILDPLWKPEEEFEAGHEQAPAPELQTLPSIVVVIDEFADMIMIVGKKVEQLIARIAQKARAAGIHLILATQRPSVDVITGLIKANIPTRISFQVSSRVDSRTILDQAGAETLLGQGDMLFLPPGTAVPIRVHGAFVDDGEVHRVVEFLKEQGEPDYIDGILEGAQPGETGDGVNPVTGFADADTDPLYDQAVAFVLESRRASTSGVQRQLRIGYNRAARIIDQMEQEGLVSPMRPNGSREILVPGGDEQGS